MVPLVRTTATESPVSSTVTLNPAVRLVEGLGGRSATAFRFKVSNEAVRLWLERGIPTDRALEVEEVTKATDFAITATEVLQWARKQKAAA